MMKTKATSIRYQKMHYTLLFGTSLEKTRPGRFDLIASPNDQMQNIFTHTFWRST